MTPLRIVLIGCAAVLAFDTAGAIAAEANDFDYEALWPGSFLIYAATAFLTARAAGNVRGGALAGLALAATDATFGWAISWLIGPGAPDPADRDAATVVVAALLVAATGAIIGAVAGLAGRRAARPA
jgi:hypothetical protein